MRSFLLWLALMRSTLAVRHTDNVKIPVLLSALNKLGTSVSKFVVGQVALSSANPLRDLVIAQVAEWLPGALATFAAGIATDYRSNRVLYIAPNVALMCIALGMANAAPEQLSGLFAVYATLGAFSSIPITALFRARVQNPIRDGATRDICDGIVQLLGPVFAGFLLYPLLGQKAIVFDSLSFLAVVSVFLIFFHKNDFRNPGAQALNVQGLRNAIFSLLRYSRETGAIWLLIAISVTWGLRDTLGLLWLKESLGVSSGSPFAFIINDTNKAVAAYLFAAALGQIFGAWSIKEVTPRISDPNWRSRAMVLAGIGSVVLAVCCLMPCLGSMKTEHLVFLRFLDGIGSTIAWSSLTIVIVLGTPPEQNGMAQAVLKVLSGVLLSSVKLTFFLPVVKELPLSVAAVFMTLVSVWLIKSNVHD
jgi:hypothetical protein